MRRLFVLGMLLWACPLWAQSLDKLPIKFNFWTAEPVLTMDMAHGKMPVSGGCSGYSFGKTAYTLLAPSDIAAQGGVAVTMNFSATDGTNASHNLTVGVGTTLTINWKGLNLAPLTGGSNSALVLTYALDNGQQGGPWYIPTTASGSVNYTFSAQFGWSGHVGHFLISAIGKSGLGATQDRVNVTVTNQSPGIYSTDGVHTNVYLQANPNFGGGDMMHTCQICIDYPTACSGAQHTPYISGSMTNHTSGEVQTFQRQQAGSVVSENDPISGSAFWAISALPGDDTDGEATGEIFCSAVADDIFNQNNPNNDGLGVPGIELAWFKGTIKQSTCKLFNYKGNAGVDCKYLYGTQSDGSRTFPMCTTRTWIPDFQPNDVFIPAALVPGYPDLALVPPFYFALSAGLRWPNLPGYPWQFPFYYLDQVTPVLPPALAQATDLLNWTFISQNSKIRDCTSADNGYQVLIYFPGID